jgi:hypothetical protein
MREIKFRAWFHDPEEPICGEMADMAFCIEEDLIQFKGNAIEPTDGCTILMQYTGLKDKNGKEIYEGDIIMRNGEAVAVTWIRDPHDLPGWQPFCGDLTDSCKVYRWEVVGNIYENPELVSQ